ncbi:hypothetical protein JHK87_025933 [Glycine soja]|nr:hypothetical protein JHK87_025933 [Glycine soja]
MLFSHHWHFFPPPNLFWMTILAHDVFSNEKSDFNFCFLFKIYDISFLLQMLYLDKVFYFFINFLNILLF